MKRKLIEVALPLETINRIGRTNVRVYRVGDPDYRLRGNSFASAGRGTKP